MLLTPRFLLLALGALVSAALRAVTPASSYDGMVLPFREVVVSAPVQSTLVEVAVK